MKTKWPTFIMFIAVMTLFLYQTFQVEHSLNSLLLPIFILFLFAIFDQFRLEKEMIEQKITQKDMLSVIFVLLGFVLTFGLHYYLDIPQIPASAMTGLLGYVFLKKYEKEVYCGSFAGMFSLIAVGPIFVLLMIFILPIVYVFSKSVFNGLGGKLGTIAFVAGSIAVGFLKDYQVISTVTVPEVSIPIVMGTALITIVILYMIKVKFDLSGVFLSAGFSLLAFLILRFIPEGLNYLPVVFVASFIIMSDQVRMKTPSFLVIAPIVMSLIYILTTSVYTGIGGKAGLTAFLAVLITGALLNTFQMMLHKDK